MSEICRHHVSKKIRIKPILLRFIRSVLASCSLISLTSLPATAGGLSLYEIATSDVGLASAGWAARAQDELGAQSAPSPEARFKVNHDPWTPPDGDVGCGAAPGSPVELLMALSGLLVLLHRRRG